MYELNIRIKVKNDKRLKKVKKKLQKYINRWLVRDEECQIVAVIDLNWKDKNDSEENL